MKHNFGIIVFGFAFVCAFLGCASTKTAVVDSAANGGSEIAVTAPSSTNGIRLDFGTIPEDVNRVFITVFPINEPVETGRESYADIRNDALAELRQTKTLACPFVQDGQNYIVGVICSTETSEYPWTSFEATANGGIYLSNKPALELDSEQSKVAFSVMPEFANNVNYADNKYNYTVTVIGKENNSYGYTERTNNMQCNFSGIVDDFNTDEINLQGIYPAYITAFCNLKNGIIPWTVAVARTEDFTLDF
jgi:hypothetical protein